MQKCIIFGYINRYELKLREATHIHTNKEKEEEKMKEEHKPLFLYQQQLTKSHIVQSMERATI